MVLLSQSNMTDKRIGAVTPSGLPASAIARCSEALSRSIGSYGVSGVGRASMIIVDAVTRISAAPITGRTAAGSHVSIRSELSYMLVAVARFTTDAC